MAIIAIDFDDTLVKGDKLISGAREAVNLLREKGHKILIYSCNNASWIEKVLRNNDIRYDRLFAEQEFMKIGKPVADIYIDDRGYRFTGDWGKSVKEVLELLNG